jgi:type IV pilus assembly protein PilQ
VDTSDKLRDEEMAQKAAAQRVAELEPLITQIIEIDFANADEVSESVKAILSSRGKIETDTRTNSLVVNDRAQIVERVANLARELDTRTPQVHIDALMVDIDTRRTRELGVSWYGTSIGPDAGHDSPFEGLSPSDVELGGGVNRPLTDVAGRINVGIIDDWGVVRADIQALSVKNLANIVSNPRITTTDNREASILVGQKIPLITQDVAGNAMTQLETIGIRLIVTPHINSDRQITLDVHPEVSDLSSQATVQGGVIINTSEADTRVLVANGETAVIAGLIRNLVTDYDSGVPYLKDIPLLGNLFKTSSKIKQQRELVVFLTPQIVEADDSVGTERDWQIREDIKGAVEDGHNPVLR